MWYNQDKEAYVFSIKSVYYFELSSTIHETIIVDPYPQQTCHGSLDLRRHHHQDESC